MSTGSNGWIGVFCNLRRIPRPGDHAEPPAALGNKIVDELQLRVRELVLIDVANSTLVRQQFISVSGIRESASRRRWPPARTTDRRWSEGSYLHRLVAHQRILDVTDTPARISINEQTRIACPAPDRHVTNIIRG